MKHPKNRKIIFPRKRIWGFTLVELLLVMAIIGIISSISIISLISFQRHQRLVYAVRDVNTLLNIAKSRAQSQVKPPVCESQTPKWTLIGYKVILIQNGPAQVEHTLYAICDNGIAHQLIFISNKKLTNGIIFNGGGINEYTFNVLSGRVNWANLNPSTDLNFTYGAETIKITIFRDGRVSLVE